MSSSPRQEQVDLERRRALAAGGLSLAFLWLGSGKANAFINARRQPDDAAAAAADGHPAFAPNAFIRIDPTGPVRLVMPNVEMGQGIYTGTCAMLAEELDVGMDQIVVEHAPPDESLYGIPLLGGQVTGDRPAPAPTGACCARREPLPAPCSSARPLSVGASIRRRAP